MIPILESKGLLPEFKIGSDVFVAYIGKELEIRKKAVEITQALRREGLKAEYDVRGRKLRKALDYANALNIPCVVILGKRDLEQGRVTIRDMESGEQFEVPLNAIVEKVKGLLKK